MTTRRTPAAAAVLAAAVLATAPTVALAASPSGAGAQSAGSARTAAPDPFYSSLLRDGRTELLRGDAAGAVRDLRIACFGFLDFPTLLAECRLREALAEAALGDRDAFVETFGKIEELEERFGVYAAAAVTADERSAFEQKTIEWVAPEVLRAIPAFATMLERNAEAALAKLSPKERERELERRAAANPKDPRWPILLAEGEVAKGRFSQAIERLGETPNGALDGRAGCLRGRALAELDRCEPALAALAGCAAAANDARLADLELSCLLELDRTAEARSFAATLTSTVASRPEIRKRIAKIPAPATTSTPEAARPSKPVSGGSAASVASSRSPTSPPAAPAKSAPDKKSPEAPRATAAKPAPAELARVEEARRLLRTSGSREALAGAIATVQPVADRYPAEASIQQLVGELAYRTSNWSLGSAYLSRPAGQAPVDPTLRFYYAVCQYESGDRAGAAATVRTGLDKLPRTPLVESYLRKIRGTD